jgi:hypothetical protein
MKKKEFNLDKSARLIFALEMYEIIENKNFKSGFCATFQMTIYGYNFFNEYIEQDLGFRTIFLHFDELQKYNPKRISSDWWFPDCGIDEKWRKKRLEILDKVIYELSK